MGCREPRIPAKNPAAHPPAAPFSASSFSLVLATTDSVRANVAPIAAVHPKFKRSESPTNRVIPISLSPWIYAKREREGEGERGKRTYRRTQSYHLSWSKLRRHRSCVSRERFGPRSGLLRRQLLGFRLPMRSGGWLSVGRFPLGRAGCVLRLTSSA